MPTIGGVVATGVTSVNGETGAVSGYAKTADVTTALGSYATTASLSPYAKTVNLAAVASSGSAADLATGQLGTARLPVAAAPTAQVWTATITLDATVGNRRSVSAGGNTKLNAPTNGVAGQALTIELLNTTSAAITVTLGSGIGVGPDASASLAVNASKVAFVTLYYSGQASRWIAVTTWAEETLVA